MSEDESCPTCGGDGEVLERVITDARAGHGRPIIGDCPDCDGEGTETAYQETLG